MARKIKSRLLIVSLMGKNFINIDKNIHIEYTMLVSTYIGSVFKMEKTRMTSEDRKKQILESAINVFIENGYIGSTTAEIAKAANISEVTLFRHFESKKEIFMASIEPIVFNTLKESITASKELNPKEKLEYILTERLMLISKNRDVMKLLIMESQINKELKSLNYIEKMSTLLRAAISEIDIPMKENKFIMRVLMGAILSFLYLPEEDEDNIEDFVKKIVKVIIKN
jgi:AcrR family transcriptional regulator